MAVDALGCVCGIMEPFDTVKIKKKGGLAWFSIPAEETGSMQLFLQRLHLVEYTATQAVEVSPADFYRRRSEPRIMVGILVEGEN